VSKPAEYLFGYIGYYVHYSYLLEQWLLFLAAYWTAIQHFVRSGSASSA
jgi:hypothetical protein